MDDQNQIYRTLQQDGMRGAGGGGEASKMEDIFKRKTKGTVKGKGTVEQTPKCLNKTQKDKTFFEVRGKKLNKREKNGKI